LVDDDREEGGKAIGALPSNEKTFEKTLGNISRPGKLIKEEKDEVSVKELKKRRPWERDRNFAGAASVDFPLKRGGSDRRNSLRRNDDVRNKVKIHLASILVADGLRTNKKKGGSKSDLNLRKRGKRREKEIQKIRTRKESFWEKKARED